MKLWFLLFFFFSRFISAQVPQLWGLAEAGSGNPEGILFKINGDGTAYTIEDTIKGINGGTPPGKLIQAGNGKLYGMTLNGGANGLGVIFSYDVFSSVFTKLYDFNVANGSKPYGSLIEASNGKLYGMTQSGGNFGNGVIFSLDPSGNTFSKVYDFSLLSGSIPSGNLTESTNGLFYGMTSSGGSNGLGTIFSFNPIGNIFSKLHNFNGTDGKSPLGSLLHISNGKLYGMTYLGGLYSSGVVFCFNPFSNIYSVLYNFIGSNGQYPIGSLVQATNGKLYGMTSNGGTTNSGVIFSLDTSNNAYLKVFDFSNGEGPNGSLMQASDGNLYGMTETGGANFLGTIFSFNVSNNSLLSIFDFGNNSYGYNPSGDLTELKITMGISNNKQNDLLVFPNPGSGIITITNFINIDEISVKNIFGQEIYACKPNTEKTTISLSKTGIYFVLIKSGTNTVTRKIIID